MVERSAKYWREFTAHGDLRATSTETGKPVRKTGRGTFIVGVALKMVEAGLWERVEVKHWKAKAWLPLADVPYRDRSVR